MKPPGMPPWQQLALMSAIWRVVKNNTFFPLILRFFMEREGEAFDLLFVFLWLYKHNLPWQSFL